jgi:23S rRNA (cytosine1962-C5)-methyltransferase
VHPGLFDLAIDSYPPAALVTLFDQALDGDLVEAISISLQRQKLVEAVVIQRRYLPKSPSEVKFGTLPGEHVVTENGTKYAVALGNAQNTGLFLDMAEGRRWLKENANGKRVLNLFAFTCSLSVAALAGGASHVVNVDMAKGPLSMGRLSHRLNGIEMSRVEFFSYNVLKSWNRMKSKGPFDIVIIDPPSFQKGSFVASRDYAKVVRKLPGLLPPTGGLVLAALNSPKLGPRFITDLFSTEYPEASTEASNSSDCNTESKMLGRIANPDVFADITPDAGLKLLLFSMGPLGTNRSTKLEPTYSLPIEEDECI